MGPEPGLGQGSDSFRNPHTHAFESGKSWQLKHAEQGHLSMAPFIPNNPHCLGQHRDGLYLSEPLERKALRHGHEAESKDTEAKTETYGLKTR